MEKKGSSKMNIAIIHPDLGIGGAERLIVDAAVELASHGHNVHIFTSHHDKNRCFEETVSGTFPVTVYGSFLPRHIFYRLHAVCAYLRCIFVALSVLFLWPSFDVVLADQVSVVIPLIKLKKSTKVVFYCHFPDLLLAQHTTLLRRIYRKPLDFLEEITTGMADLILVNSKFTASTFARTFKHLDARGIRPDVLYPAVNVDQFDEPNSYKDLSNPWMLLGGAERLIVDAAVELASHGHNVHIFTSHHDKNRCFEETVSGTFPVTVYGSFLPRHIFYRLHAVCAYLRCIFVALSVLFLWPSFDVVLADQVSVVIPLIKLKKSTKVVFYCHFPDLLLAQHTTLLRRIYRKPLDFLEEITTGMADLILVNSKFTASTFARTFKHLDARGIRPDVLYPAVNVDQFDEPNSYKDLSNPWMLLGGAERLIVDAAVELASHGHNVHIFTSHHDKNRCFEETVSGTFPVTVYGSFLPRHIFYRLHAVCAYLRCIFVALSVLFLWPSFDVVLADQVSVVIPLIKLKKSTKVVFYCHFPDLLLAQHTTLLRRIYRKPLDFLEEITTGMADLILVNSKFTASTFARTFKHLDARGIRPDVLYPAVNVDQFDEPNSYKLNVLSINRFERKKNIDLAIAAFALLHHPLEANDLQGHNLDDVSLTIVGGFDNRLRENVEYLEELKSLAEREGVSHRVKFITSCSTNERNELLSQCLCVLYTPKEEHFGIVPLEAMAAYKPVIACNSGGPVETIKNGETGFLCDPNPRDFSLAMANFIRDPHLAERMGREAREHVTNSFSTKTFGERLNRFLVDKITRQKIE